MDKKKLVDYDVEKRMICYIQLVIIMLSIASFPYMIEQSTHGDDNELFPIISEFVDFVFTPMFPLVSAASDGVLGCCSQASDGSRCVQTDSFTCSGDFAAGATCDSVSFCQTGCCYNDTSGIYDEAVLEDLCTLDWAPDPFCNLPGAALGCCVLGETTRFETEGQCRVHSEVFALSSDGEYDWRSGLNELECILLSGEQITGACVFNNEDDLNDCDFVTESSCLSLGGEFHPELLCTADELETSCEMTEETTCVDGKDGVYFVDSCGNTANIYDSSRATDPTYWRSAIEIEDSCTAPNGGQDSASCGNCNRFEGGICAPAELDDFDVNLGEYYCKNTACEYTDYWGVEHDYKNGESWCVYESDIDDGNDAPGSRHFRYICNNGVVQVEPCADYRNEICIEQDTLRSGGDDLVGTTDFNNAYCRKNNAKNCIEIGERSMEACEDEPDCMVRSVDMGGSFDFDICLPKYPEGFSFDPQFQATGAQVCAINTRTCVVTYQPVLFGCVVIDNAGCLNRGEFDNQMDEVCTALGDCQGVAEVRNYYEDRPIQGKFAQYDPRIEKYMLAAGLTPDDYLGVGSALFEQSAFSGALFALNLDSSDQPITPEDDQTLAIISGILSALGGLLASLGGVLQNTMLMIAGAALTLFGTVLNLIGPATCPPRYVDYNCELYQPPAGGDTCDACNDNSDDIPCTEYRCKTLGTACEFINEGTEDEICIAAIDDGGFPIIEHILTIEEIIESEDLYDFPDLLDFIQDIVYKEVGDNTIEITNPNGGCVDAYTPIPIAFTTDEPAICKFDFVIDNEGYKDYEDMNFFVGLNTYKFNHSTFFQLPDPSHGVANGANETTSELEVYIKCVDRYGHETPDYLTIMMCVNDGEDVTPPRIVTTFPKDGAFISFDQDTFDLQLITNELATCRWSDEAGTLYDDMTNEFVCNDSFFSPSTSIGYVCDGVMPISASNGTEATYYVRCSDQPWLTGGDIGNRNQNTEDFVYTFNKPNDKITIDSITPSGEVTTLSDKLFVELTVETSNGALNHSCSYSFTGFETLIKMYTTGSRGIHTQELNLLPNRYDLFVECVDETGDTVQSTSSFRIIQKSSLSLISRAWQTNNNIFFVTQEEATCRYSNDGCLFDFESGELLTGDGITHRIFADKGKRYNVKCQDSVGNVPTGCSIVLTAV